MMVFRANAYGLVCVCIFYASIGYADYVVTVHMIGGSLMYSAWGMMNIVFFNTILALLVISHIRAVTNDPGLVPLNFKSAEISHVNEDEGSNGWSICSKCQVERPKDTYHCRICNRCVRRMIHHCPWINNCIGELNIKYVFMTIFYTVLASIFSFTMIATYWLLHPPYITEKQQHVKEWHTMVLSITAVVFSLFAVAVGYDLISALRGGDDWDNDPQEQTAQETSNLKAALYEVFHDGGPLKYAVNASSLQSHPILWLFPINLSPRKPIKSRSQDSVRQPLLS